MFQTSESADRIRELLDRNLQEVFGEEDAERRRAAVEELWAQDAVLYVPPGAVVGRDGISSFAGDLRATHPDFAYSPQGSPQVLQNAGRLAWGSGPPGQAFAYTGWDVIIVREGRIAALYVFLDETSASFAAAASGRKHDGQGAHWTGCFNRASALIANDPVADTQSSIASARSGSSFFLNADVFQVWDNGLDGSIGGVNGDEIKRPALSEGCGFVQREQPNDNPA